VYRASWWKKPRLQQQSWSNIHVVFYLILVLGSPVESVWVEARVEANPTWWKIYHLTHDKKTAPILAV